MCRGHVCPLIRQKMNHRLNVQTKKETYSALVLACRVFGVGQASLPVRCGKDRRGRLSYCTLWCLGFRYMGYVKGE